KRLDLIALVTPAGPPTVVRWDRNRWYTRQQFTVLDSPDTQENTITGFYFVGKKSFLEEGPQDPIPTDGGKYLLIGRKQSAGTIVFDPDCDMDIGESSPINVGEQPGVIATMSGLFPVDGVTWPESGPRWRYVYDLVALNMAHARGDALASMSKDLRFKVREDPPATLVEQNQRPDPRSVQLARLADEVHRVITDTEATASWTDKVYLWSVLAEFTSEQTGKDMRRFLDVARRAVVVEGVRMPDAYVWPSVEWKANISEAGRIFANQLSKADIEAGNGDLLDIARAAKDDKAMFWAVGEIGYLDSTPDRKAYFDLAAGKPAGSRAQVYERLMTWLKITDLTVQTEKDHGRTVGILNEDQVRQRIQQALGG
ncbi:MAG TPA: hypothetical protein VNI20_06385, partial [Fimbriimonadaceae bacterium]|nr:hypothetical protein [Fimbriimonadaceae bacterium]